MKIKDRNSYLRLWELSCSKNNLTGQLFPFGCLVLGNRSSCTDLKSFCHIGPTLSQQLLSPLYKIKTLNSIIKLIFLPNLISQIFDKNNHVNTYALPVMYTEANRVLP